VNLKLTLKIRQFWARESTNLISISADMTKFTREGGFLLIHVNINAMLITITVIIIICIVTQ
jgi:hypothetical protein